MIQIAPWQCPTCEQQVDTPFYPTCGKQPTGPRHVTLRELGYSFSLLILTLRWI
jgi:ABC-type ATPase with predicted acetyltransferase domain